MKKAVSVLLAVIMMLAVAGCSGTADKTINVTEVMKSISTQITLPSDMIEVSSADKLMDYYGIKSDDVKSFAVKINGSGVEQDEIVIIEAASADSVEAIKTALQGRLDNKSNQMKNYLPEQYEIISKCSVSVKGNYVTLFISEYAQQMTDIFNSYF